MSQNEVGGLIEEAAVFIDALRRFQIEGDP